MNLFRQYLAFVHSKKIGFSSQEIVIVLTVKWLFGFSFCFLLAKIIGHGLFFFLKLALAMIVAVVTKMEL